MRKKVGYWLLAMMMLFSVSGSIMTAGAAETPITVLIDGKTVDFGADQTPVLADTGRVLVPMRKIFETMGAKVEWAEETSTVTATKDSVSIVLTIGSDTAYKSGTAVKLDQPAVMINDRTLVPVRFVGEALGAKVDWNDENKQVLITASTEPVAKAIKVLAIGNSFSQDAAKYLHDMAAADKVDLTIVNLYIGGCSLQTHWKNAESDAKAYTYELNGAATSQKVSIEETLESDDWNYITLQQASPDSGIESSYYPYIEELAKYVKTIEPKAELLIHQTWAYEKGSDHKGFLNYQSDQGVMFDAIKKAYGNAAAKVGLLKLADGSAVSEGQKPIRIIPSGEAMQLARGNALFDTTFKDGKAVRLNRDGYHASLTYGRYLLSAVWYECLTGNKIETNTYCPFGKAEDNEYAVLKKAVHDAVAGYGWVTK